MTENSEDKHSFVQHFFWIHTFSNSCHSFGEFYHVTECSCNNSTFVPVLLLWFNSIHVNSTFVHGVIDYCAWNIILLYFMSGHVILFM